MTVYQNLKAALRYIPFVLFVALSALAFYVFFRRGEL